MSRAMLYKGYTRKLVRVNLTEGTVTVEEINNSLLKKYIASCENIAQEMVQDDLEEEQVEQIAVPELFEAWEYKNFFTLNLRYFYQRFSNP